MSCPDRGIRHRRVAVTVLPPLLFWAGVLLLLPLLVGKEFLLPSPLTVLRRLFTLAGTADFWLTILLSLLRVLGGLLLGILLGILLGALSLVSEVTEALVRPLLTVIRAVPVASFILLLWSFTGRQLLPIVIAAMMVTPLISGAITEGWRAADPQLREVTLLYRLDFRRRFLYYRLPALLPSLTASALSGVGFAWKAGISAEILSNTADSIGRQMYYAKAYLEMVDLFAWTVVVALLSLVFEVIVKKTFRKMGGKQRAALS